MPRPRLLLLPQNVARGDRRPLAAAVLAGLERALAGSNLGVLAGTLVGRGVPKDGR